MEGTVSMVEDSEGTQACSEVNAFRKAGELHWLVRSRQVSDTYIEKKSENMLGSAVYQQLEKTIRL